MPLEILQQKISLTNYELREAKLGNGLEIVDIISGHVLASVSSTDKAVEYLEARGIL